MPICDVGCAIPLPDPYSNACRVVTKPGGITRIGFIQCNYDFVDITDNDEWNAAIAAGDAVMSGLLVGSKPKGTFTKKRVDSCSPERVTGGEKTIVFQDFNDGTIFDADDCAEYTFWNTIQANPLAYRAVFVTCNGYLYGPIDRFVIEVDEIIDESNSGNRYFDGIITWNQIDMPCPVETDLEFDQESSVFAP